MKTLKIVAAVVLLSLGALAEKASLPPDLPAYGPEKPLQTPAVKVTKLENGLTVWLVAEPGFPKLSFALAVHGGLAADPADRPGISELLSNTIDQGTKTRNAKQVAEEIQAAGGDLGTVSGKDSTTVSTEVLSSKADATIALLADLVQNATFPENEVALAKRNLSDSLQQQESDPSFLAGRQMARVLFGDNPYHVTSATQESISASTASDLRKIYAQRFRPDQALLVAVGDFDNDKLLAQVKAKFGSWKAGSEAPIAAPARYSSSMKPTVFLVPRPESVQTTLELGTLGPMRTDADFAASEVANAIFGGTFGSRLTANIREDKGYTYSPFASLQTYLATGVLITRADVRNEVTAASFNEMQYELNRMATTSPTEEELNTAKRYLVGLEAIRLQVRSAVARELSRLWIYGLPPEEIGVYGKKIASITGPEVDAVAKKYFPAHQVGIVAVGEEKVVRDAFEPFGFSVEVVH
jgi:predicted Zn-dependent peptidase